MSLRYNEKTWISWLDFYFYFFSACLCLVVVWIELHHAMHATCSVITCLVCLAFPVRRYSTVPTLAPWQAKKESRKVEFDLHLPSLVT